MAKFRKKAVVIEAWQCYAAPETEPRPGWLKDALAKWPRAGGMLIEPEHVDGPRICIATLGGVMVARPGDWIVQGVDGELYLRKPDIFKAIYEPVRPLEGK